MVSLNIKVIATIDLIFGVILAGVACLFSLLVLGWGIFANDSGGPVPAGAIVFVLMLIGLVAIVPAGIIAASFMERRGNPRRGLILSSVLLGIISLVMYLLYMANPDHTVTAIVLLAVPLLGFLWHILLLITYRPKVPTAS